MDNQRGRGSYRGNTNRGNSRSRGRGGFQPKKRRSYEDIVSDTKKQTEEKEKQIEIVKTAPAIKPDQSKKDELINKGKQWFNKFFAGIKRKERGNLKIEFNEDLDLQLMDVYNYRLSNMAFTKNYYKKEDIDYSDDFFRIFVNLLIGIKLLKANTDSNKVLMKEFMPLTNLEIKAPKNLAAIINGIGKTDVGHDNVVRIIGQNSVIKQCFFKAVIMLAWFSEARFVNNMKFKEGIKWTHIDAYVKQNLMKYSDKKAYTRDLAGLDIIHAYGEKAIDSINKTDINIGTVESPVYARIPYLDPKDSKDISKLQAWEVKVRNFFTRISFDGSKYYKALGYAFMGWFPLKFIVEGDKTFSELDKSFENGIFKDVKPADILKDNGWFDIEKWMDDEMLFYNVTTVFDYYKSTMENIYDDIFHMTKFEPTEYGNGSQTVSVKSWNSGYLNLRLHNFKIDMADNNVPSKVHSKITDEESVIGSVFSFNTNITLNSAYDIHTIGTAKEIRLALVGHDFK